jgi:predicted transposase/invertase (TIGR01784 family)
VSYDDTSRFLFTQYPESFARWLIGDSARFTSFSPTELNLAPVRSDGVILLKNPKTIAHIEFQTEIHPFMPFRVVNYYVRLKYLFPDHDIRQIVIYLTKTKSKMAFQDYYQTPEMLHRFQVIRIWEQDPEIFFALPGLLPYAVLAKNRNNKATLRRVAEELETIPDFQQKIDLTAAAGILAGLKLDKSYINSIFRSDIMKQSVIYQSILQEGEEKGLSRERALVARLLHCRVGNISAALEQQVNSLNIQQVEDLGEALLNFTNSQDLSNWLKHYLSK